MRVAAFTSGRRVPSSRFRLRQHVECLAEQGISVKEYVPFVGPYPHISSSPPLPRVMSRAACWVLAGASRTANLLCAEQYDVGWVERTLWRGGECIVRLMRAPYVLDIDDAVWLSRPQGFFGAEYLARNASAVIAGNDYLGEWAAQWCDRVHVIPTAVDCSFDLLSPAPARKEFAVGWIGTSANLKYLESIQTTLNSFFTTHPDSVLRIMSDKPPSLSGILSSRVMFVPWSEASEHSFIENLDVGLMPLHDSPWERGKCSFKMLQYMSHGKPVVVSNVGMNVDVLSQGRVGFGIDGQEGWGEALSALYFDREMMVEMGLRGRSVAREHYGHESVARRIAGVLLGV